MAVAGGDMSAMHSHNLHHFVALAAQKRARSLRQTDSAATPPPTTKNRGLCSPERARLSTSTTSTWSAGWAGAPSWRSPRGRVSEEGEDGGGSDEEGGGGRGGRGGTRPRPGSW